LEEEACDTFITQNRKEFRGWKKGDHIPVDLMAVSWSDGDLSQIENIVNNESLELYRDKMITACKQNPQRTGTEESADLTKTFPIMQYLQQTITLQDGPIERHPMKRAISNQLLKLFLRDGYINDYTFEELGFQLHHC